MNGIALFNALTKIDDRFIDRAEKAPAVPERPRRAPVLRWVEIAACACLLLTVSLLIANRIGLFGRPGGGPPRSSRSRCCGPASPWRRRRARP